MSQSRRIYLLRHAKSNWDTPGQADHERSLSERGRQALRLISGYLQDQQIHPELVLCSSARRTRETLEGLAPQSTVLIEHRLYGATSDDLLERLRLLPPDLSSVMVIGHNPAMQLLALQLAGSESAERPPGAEGLAEIRRKLPTGALVALAFHGEWADLAPGAARLADFVRPKAL